MQQFADNLVRMEIISKEWDKTHKSSQQEELSGVENHIQELYDKNNEGVFTIEEIGILNKLEGKKDSLLLNGE